jgi:hypothetical protein
MLFSSKMGHFAQILSSGLLGDFVVNQLTPPTPDEVQAWGSMIIQLLVALVTIWATIRKALQKPGKAMPTTATQAENETTAPAPNAPVN